MNSLYLNTRRFSDAAALGFKVFPVLAKDKVPAVSWTKFKDSCVSAEQLAEWDRSDFNVGVICGAPSNLVVIDVDSDDAQSYYDSLGFPDTPYVLTRKGRHYYFRNPVGGLSNRVRVDGVPLDVRGEGGYVIGVGSIHPSGALYAWGVSPDEMDFAEIPESLLDTIRGKSVPKGKRNSPAVGDSPELEPNRFDRLLRHKLDEAVETLRESKEGERNNALFKVAAKLSNYVSGAQVGWAPFAHQLKSAALSIGLEECEIEATLASAWRVGSQTPIEWMRVAIEWVYLSNPQVFYHLESGNSLRRAGFNSAFAHSFGEVLDSFLLHNGLIDTFYDLTYEPASPDRVIEKDGLRYLNTYRPSGILAEKGNATPFADFLAYLVPDEEERAHLLKMMAWVVRKPGHKLRHALLLRSASQGVGKSMLVDIWSALLGASNVRKTTTEEVSGPYQGYIKETQLVVLEELNWGFGPTGYNRLKDIITADVTSVNEKYLPVRLWPNVASFVILTNLEMPMLIEDQDRRIFYIDSPATPRSREYYALFAAWWKANLGVIRGYLEEVDLESFNPFAPPPMTAAKSALIAASRGDLVQELAIMIEERAGTFVKDILTMAEIEREASGINGRWSRRELREALGKLGAIALGQHRISGSPLDSPSSSGGWRESLWAIRHVDYWQDASPAERAAEYLRPEGLLAQFDPRFFLVHQASRWPGGTTKFLENFEKG